MDDQASKPQSAEQWVIDTSKHKPNIKFVLVMLARCIDQGNSCPSHNDLAKMTGLSKDTVRRSLGELSKENIIVIGKNGGDKVHGGQKDCYSIVGFNTPAPEPKPEPASTQPIGTQPGSHVQPGSSQPIGTQQPGSNPEDAPAYTHEARGDAAGEKDLSLKQETTTTLLPAHQDQVAIGADSGGGEVRIRVYAPETKPLAVPALAPANIPIQELDNDLGKVAKCYEDNIAPLVEVMREKLITAIDLYSANWIVEAIGIAVEQNIRTWAYVHGVLRRWKTKGKDSGKTAPSTKSISAQQLADNRRWLDEQAARDGELYVGVRR